MKVDQFKPFILNVGVAFLMTHELDAVMNSEWLVLPLTSWLSPTVGYEVFLWFHVPLFAVILTLLTSSSNRVREITASTLSVFLIAHAGLHWLFSDHQHYEFSSISSKLLVYGGAVIGVFYLIINQMRKRDHE
jgi:hypothetical protein